MANRIRYRRRARQLYRVLCLSLPAAVLSVMLATPPACAEEQRNGKDNEARYAPAVQQVAERGRGREEHGGYHRGGRRDYYTSAPPVVYAPQGYYQQPGSTLYFELPTPAVSGPGNEPAGTPAHWRDVCVPIPSKEFIRMRYVNLATVALLGMTTISALAQAPGLDPATGARPGHVPGTWQLTASVQQRQ